MSNKIPLTPQAADKIREIIKDRGISQEFFATQSLEVTHRTFQYWLSGEREIPFKQLDKIQEFFNVSIKEIYGYLPHQYEKTTTNVFELLKKLIKINIKNFRKNKARRGFKYYADKLASVVHIHPLPTDEHFRVIDIKTSEDIKDYYLNFSINVLSSEPPTGDEFVIGFVIDELRIRFDFGKIIIKDEYLEVEEVFTSLFSRHYVSFDKKQLSNGTLFQIAAWVGQDDIKFVIYSKNTPFEIELHEKIQEESLYKENKDGVVLFRRGVWQ